MKKIALLGLLGFSGLVQATTVTIDFEDVSLGASNFTTNGYQFSEFAPGGGSGAVQGTSGVDQYLGLSVSGFCSTFCATASVIMTRADGEAFSLLSADLLPGCGIGIQCDSGALGIMVGGGTASGPIGSSDWLNLQEVRFYTSGSDPSYTFQNASLQVDNLVVQAVPVPAAIWLFGTALASLGFWRRIRNTA